jgi:hypothetical protein
MMQIRDALEQSIIILKESIGSTIERLENDSEEFDPNEAFDGLVLFAEAKAQLREYETRLNQLMVLYMRQQGERALFFGDMVAERRISSTRKNWEHKTLLEAVVNKSLSEESASVVDPSTGEVLDLSYYAKPLIDNVVRNLAVAAAIRDWRVTALKAMIPGLNPDDFCEVEKAERVSIRKK